MGLPYVPPYFGPKNGNFDKGVNFAVAGATALESSFLMKRGIHPHTNVSLGVQLKSFKKSLPDLCGSPSGSVDQFFLFFLAKSLLYL